MRGVAVVGFATFALLVPGTAHADGEPQAQTISWQQVPDLVVGQFAELRATASSGLDVLLQVDRPCLLRDVPGGAAIIVASAAGKCLVSASQSGDAIFAPAPVVQQFVTFVPSESDVSLVIPGRDVVLPGSPLKAFVSVTGEEGDDPAPTGVVDVVVRDAGGVAVASGEVELDTAGNGLFILGGDSTSGWAPGPYSLTAQYRGNDSFHASMSDPLPMTVGASACSNGADCAEPIVVKGVGGITMTVDPSTVISGGSSFAVVAAGFPPPQLANDINVEISELDRRESPNWQVTHPQILNGWTESAFGSGREGTFADVKVRVAYSWTDSAGKVYADTLEATVAVRGRRVPMKWAWPYSLTKYKEERVREGGQEAIKTAYAEVRFSFQGETVTATGVDPFGRPCPAVSWWRDRTGESNAVVSVATVDSCVVTITAPATEDEAENQISLTFYALCYTDGQTRCKPGGEPNVRKLPAPRVPQTGRTVVVDPASKAASAPVIDARAGESLHIRAPWAPIGDTLTLLEKEAGGWTRVASLVVGSDGYASLPTLFMDSVGVRQYKVMDNGVGYFAIRV